MSQLESAVATRVQFVARQRSLKVGSGIWGTGDGAETRSRGTDRGTVGGAWVCLGGQSDFPDKSIPQYFCLYQTGPELEPDTRSLQWLFVLSWAGRCPRSPASSFSSRLDDASPSTVQREVRNNQPQTSRTQT